jgi:hypothetical protein
MQVIELMRTFELDPEVQREALVSIGSLAYKSNGRKLRLMDLGAGEAVVAALSNHKHEVKVVVVHRQGESGQWWW